MADIYRSEILAVVMQQIVDEPVLPTLFLRTVSFFFGGGDKRPGSVGSPLLTRTVRFVGDSSGEDVQIAGRVRLDHPSLAVDHQKDLDERTAVGRVYRVCEGHCTCELWSAVAAA